MEPDNCITQGDGACVSDKACIHTPPRTVEDFKGKVDGGGYKAVMDNPKLPLELISPQFLNAIAEVLQHGAKKYAPNNWLRGMSYVCVFGSILRHLFMWAAGVETDTDSKLPHLHHAACGLMFLIHYTEMQEYENFDDRVFNR